MKINGNSEDFLGVVNFRKRTVRGAHREIYWGSEISNIFDDFDVWSRIHKTFANF